MRPFLHELAIEPVSGAGGAAFLRATSREVRRLTVGGGGGGGDRAGDRTKLPQTEREREAAARRPSDDGLSAKRLRDWLPQTVAPISPPEDAGPSSAASAWELASWQLNSSQSLPPSSATSSSSAENYRCRSSGSSTGSAPLAAAVSRRVDIR